MNDIIYTKTNALQTRGLAIISMVCLHLFCRKGADVYGTPLIWTSEKVPLVYWLGFVSGICVPLYSLCAGYAQELLDEIGKGGYIANIKRSLRLIINFWIVLLLFTLLSLFAGTRNDLPINFADFLQQAFLINYKNGAWWYLRTYIIIMLIPPMVLLWPVKHINWIFGIIICFSMTTLGYFIRRFNLIPSNISNIWITKFFISYLCIFTVLPFIWIGGFVCKCKLFNRINSKLNQITYERIKQNIIICSILGIGFIFICILEKSVVLDFYALLVFLLFNLIHKNVIVEKIFLFFGMHSTNIWLVHMFFYCCLFIGLVQHAKYPLFIFIYMMFLCIVSSYIIMLIQCYIEKISSIFVCFQKGLKKFS